MKNSHVKRYCVIRQMDPNSGPTSFVRTLFLNLHVMFRLVSYVEVFCSLFYSFGSFFLAFVLVSQLVAIVFV